MFPPCRKSAKKLLGLLEPIKQRVDHKAADQGLAEAQHNLGKVHHFGEGVQKDEVEAVRWYRKAADQGFAAAQSNLGAAYYLGEGVPKDYAEAVRWFRKAADQGDSHAQYQLADAYHSGKSVPQNYAEAYFWLDLAAGGNAGMEDKEIGRERDEEASHLTKAQVTQVQERARKWFEKHSTESSQQ